MARYTLVLFLAGVLPLHADAPEQLRTLTNDLAAEAFDASLMADQMLQYEQNGYIDHPELLAMRSLRTFYEHTRRLLTLSHQLGTKLPPVTSLRPFRAPGAGGSLKVELTAAPVGTDIEITEATVGVIPERRYMEAFWETYAAARKVEGALGFAWGLSTVYDRWVSRVQPVIDQMESEMPRLRRAMEAVERKTDTPE